MAYAASAAWVRQMGSLFEGGTLAGLSDRQLLERFVARRDDLAEAAFAAIVARHGPMVLGVCRQLVGDHQLAEDAFQATFLVLARKAYSLRDPGRLATWLYGVALRTAHKARSRTARRRRHEEGDIMDAAIASIGPPADQAVLDRDQAEALHVEIDRLPEAFRSPVVLCYFEGLTLDQAAARLGCPAGTLRSRLARAREKLRRALTRRGVALSGAALAAVLDARPAAASVSPHLCDVIARAAIRFPARPTIASTSATLAHEVLRAMTIHKLRAAFATLLIVAAFAVGAGYSSHSLNAFAASREGEPPGEPIAQAVRTEPRPPDEPSASGRMTVVGRVLDLDGKPVPNATVMVHAADRRPGLGGSFEVMSPTSIGQARSDGSGRFRLDATRTTSARHHSAGAVAMAPGYGAGWVELDPDDDQPKADIRLRPEQVIEGRLFDVNGRPVRDVEVTVQSMGDVAPLPMRTFVRESTDRPSFSPSRGNELPAWPRSAFSDAEGRFTLRGVGRGVRVVIIIHDPRFARLKIPIDTDGTSRSRSVTLALEPARIIAGRVTDADTERPVPHARLWVLAYKGDAGIIDRFEADDQGRFRMNPLAADRYHVNVSSNSGRPYLDASPLILDWPRGAVEHRLDVALRPGVAIRGKVVEEGTGRPVAGARVSFGSTRIWDEATGDINSNTVTAADGSFQLAALPAPGYLIVQGPSYDYVYQVIGDRVVTERRPGGRRMYAHAFTAYDPKPGVDGPEVTVRLRRGGTVTGRIVGPNGRPIPSAVMIGRVFVSPTSGTWRFLSDGDHGRVRDGRFEVHGLDPDAEVPISFFAPNERLGATLMLSGKSGSGGPVIVRLEPCGTARARLIDRDKKPVARFPGARLISMVVTPGASLGDANQQGQLADDEAAFSAIDRARYAYDPLTVSDTKGRISLPDLIPGASYRVRAGPRGGPPSFRKDFTVKPGETVDLGEIVVERAPG